MRKKEAKIYDQQGFSSAMVQRVEKFMREKSDTYSQEIVQHKGVSHATIEKIAGALLRRD